MNVFCQADILAVSAPAGSADTAEKGEGRGMEKEEAANINSCASVTIVEVSGWFGRLAMGCRGWGRKRRWVGFYVGLFVSIDTCELNTLVCFLKKKHPDLRGEKTEQRPPVTILRHALGPILKY